MNSHRYLDKCIAQNTETEQLTYARHPMTLTEIVYKTTNPTTPDEQPKPPNNPQQKQTGDENTPRGEGPLPDKEKNSLIS